METIEWFYVRQGHMIQLDTPEDANLQFTYDENGKLVKVELCAD